MIASASIENTSLSVYSVQVLNETRYVQIEAVLCDSIRNNGILRLCGMGVGNGYGLIMSLQNYSCYYRPIHSYPGIEKGAIILVVA